MMKPRKNIHFNFGSLAVSVFLSFLLIGAFWFVAWLILNVVKAAGYPFPKIAMDRFLDFGLFALSNFNLVMFLSMILFQTAEGKLSPGFYIQTVKRSWFHFGLYVLMSCFLFTWVVSTIFRDRISDELLSQLYIAVAASVVFAIIFHRYQTIRYLHHPLIVYENLTKLIEKDGSEKLWLDLYECTLKAIKDNRIGDTLDFCKLLSVLHEKSSDPEKIYHHHKDLESLYKCAKDHHPLASYFEKQWPFLQKGKRILSDVEEPSVLVEK